MKCLLSLNSRFSAIFKVLQCPCMVHQKNESPKINQCMIVRVASLVIVSLFDQITAFLGRDLSSVVKNPSSFWQSNGVSCNYCYGGSQEFG